MAELGNRDASQKSWIRRHGVTLLLSLGLLAGLGLLAYPTVSDWWNQYHQTRAIATYQEQVKAMDDTERQQELAAARDYNRRLVQSGPLWKMNDAQRAVYDRQLDFSSNHVMGYVDIQKIGVQLPIYHGTDEAVLQTSIGHLEGTSLPVGCGSFDTATGAVADPAEGTHCALTGHRGLPRAKLFSDLDKLVEGDVFTVSVLDEVLTYEVDQIRIVLPANLVDLQILPGQDLCTLVTCTPYGINSHRLLVRGHRIDNILGTDSVTPDAIAIPRYIAVPAVGVPILFVFLLVAMLHYRRQRLAVRPEQLRELIRDRMSDEER